MCIRECQVWMECEFVQPEFLVVSQFLSSNHSNHIGIEDVGEMNRGGRQGRKVPKGVGESTLLQNQ